MSIDYSALVGPAKDPNKCREGRGVAKIKSIGEYPSTRWGSTRLRFSLEDGRSFCLHLDDEDALQMLSLLATSIRTSLRK